LLILVDYLTSKVTRTVRVVGGGVRESLRKKKKKTTKKRSIP